jgi:transcriptional regulator with XRE-family HTH domain
MAKTYEEMMKRLTSAQRKRVEARAAVLIAEEKSLRDLRHAIALTQERVARDLGISQDQVSKLEKRSDLLISTLRRYVEAMGGKLRLSAEFPDRPPVLIGGLIATVAGTSKARRRE